ncbi:MAG: hypothetical protein R3B90_12580 [Planctomycetaceae bacterium]
MTYTYCKQWFRAKKCPIDIWDDGVAQFAHENRKAYSVLSGSIEHPAAFIEIHGDFVGVGFLDDRLREYLSYQFQEVESGRLFLTMATHREFQGDSDNVASGTTYIFKQNGMVDIEGEDSVAGTKSARQMTSDVSGNWESYPSFGEYESLLKVERVSPSTAT